MSAEIENCKKCPWRRRYQQVQVTNLLHASGGTTVGDPLSCLYSDQKTDILTTNQHLIAKETLQEDTSAISEVNHKDETNFFDKYLFLPSVQLEPEKESRANPQNRNRLNRNQRRHTDSCLGSISREEIENWICEVSSAKTNGKSGKSITHDNSRLLFLQPKVTALRSAQNKPCSDWNDNTKQPREEKKKATVMLHQIQEVEKRESSCRQISTNGLLHNVSKRLEERQDHISGDWSRRVAMKEPFANGEECDILRRGINNPLSCFLTPRAYKKNVTLDDMLQSRKSWNGFDVIMDIEVKRRNSNDNVSSHTEEENGNASPRFDEDYNIPAKSQSKKSTRGNGAKYSTFLDLSNLMLDDDEEHSEYGSPAEQITSSSDHEDSVNGDLERHYDVTGRSLYENRYFDSGYERCEENVEGIVQKVIGNTLDKIEEVDEPIEVNMEEREESNTGVSISDIDFKLLQEEKSFPVEDENVDANTRETGDLGRTILEHKEAHHENDVTVKATAPKGTSELMLEAVEDQNVKNNYKTSSDDDHSTLSSDDNDDNESYYDAIAVGKTTSLDRNLFRTEGNKSQESHSTSNKTDAESSKRASTSTPSKPEVTSANADSANLRSGLKRLFHITMTTVKEKGKPRAIIRDVFDLIESKGIKLSDPRMRETFRRIEKEAEGPESSLNIDVFTRICEPSFKFIRSVLLSQLTIPGFSLFKLRLFSVFEKILEVANVESDLTSTIDPCSNYNVIMRKRRTGKPHISMSVCTVDGQRCSFGDSETPHPLNACASVFNYCLACRQHSIESLSRYFNNVPKPAEKEEFALKPGEKVWNPFTKSGSILSSLMVFRDVAKENRLDSLHEFYSALTGREPLCCDNLSYNYKRFYAHEEIALAYYLSATQRLPRGAAADLSDSLDFHFQAASSAMTSDACAVAAATLANGGVCPLTGESVLDETNVRHTLETVRSSHVIYATRHDKNRDMSVSWSEYGSILLVVPGVLGITCFVQCQSTDVINKVVTSLVEGLNTNFNFSVYRSLNDHRNVIFRQ